MSTINQKVAFARAAEKKDKSAKKSKGTSKKKLTPVSRKGKSKFKY